MGRPLWRSPLWNRWLKHLLVPLWLSRRHVDLAMLIPGLTMATLELTMPGCLLYLHLRSPRSPGLQAPKTTTTMEERVESLAEERVESLAEERVERAMPMATTTTMTTMMMMIMVLGTLLTV